MRLRVSHCLSALLFCCCLVQVAVLPQRLFADNGIFLQGIGMKSTGMGGVSVALPQDSLAAVSNPAGMSAIGREGSGLARFDIGSQFLVVQSNSNIPLSPTKSWAFDTKKVFAPIPDLGVNYQVNPKTTLGLSVWGAGLVLSFKNPMLPPTVLPGLQNGKVGLLFVQSQLTGTYKVHPKVAIGISPVFSILKYNVTGVAAVTPGGPVALPNYNNAWAAGYGAKAGVLYNVTRKLNVGASYSTRVQYTKLQGYRDTLAASSNGRLNLPEQYAAGVSYVVTPKLTVGFDWVRYGWSKVGFGKSDQFAYHDQNAEKFGAAYQLTPNWTIRGGYGYSPRNTNTDAVANTMLLPAIHQQALTFGATRKVGKGGELSFMGDHDFGGGNPVGTGPSAGYKVDSKYGFFGVEYGVRF